MKAVTQQEAGPLTLVEPTEQQALVEQPTHTLAVADRSPAGLMLTLMSKGASLADIGQMMDLQERWEKREAEKAFVAAMAEFKSEPITIFKRKKVGYETKDGDFVGYSHAELSDVTDAVGPAMARHGLSYRWDIKQENARVIVSCIVTHRLGHSERVQMDAAPDNSGKKNAIQQIASASQYLQRYTLLAATGMSTKGMDDDGQGAYTDPSSPAGVDRRNWINARKEDIRAAKTVGELKKVLAEAIAKTQENEDFDAEVELRECANAKQPKDTPQ